MDGVGLAAERERCNRTPTPATHPSQSSLYSDARRPRPLTPPSHPRPHIGGGRVASNRDRQRHRREAQVRANQGEACPLQHPPPIVSPHGHPRHRRVGRRRQPREEHRGSRHAEPQQNGQGGVQAPHRRERERPQEEGRSECGDGRVRPGPGGARGRGKWKKGCDGVEAGKGLAGEQGREFGGEGGGE